MSDDEACLRAFQDELDYIQGTLRRLGAAHADVDDLTQEVFLALRRSWPGFDARRPLRPFLFGIAFRIVAAHRRKHRREVNLGHEMEERADGSSDLEDAVQNNQARRLVQAALDHIPLPRRAVLVMRDFDDVPMGEVAAALKLPLFTAYARLYKARVELEVALRRMLSPSAEGGEKSGD